ADLLEAGGNHHQELDPGLAALPGHLEGGGGGDGDHRYVHGAADLPDGRIALIAENLLLFRVDGVDRTAVAAILYILHYRVTDLLLVIGGADYCYRVGFEQRLQAGQLSHTPSASTCGTGCLRP